MRMRDENMFELKLFGGDAIKNRLCIKSGVEQSGVARDFVPDEIAVHGKIFGGRGEHADFAPDGQIFFRGQPAAGDGFEFLRIESEDFCERGEIYLAGKFSSFFERGKIAFGNGRRVCGGGS